MTSVMLFQNSKDLVEYEPGAVIFRQGDPGDLMYVVVEGEVEIRSGEVVIDTVRAGGLLGELALVDKGPRTASAIALTRSKLAELDEKRFSYMVQTTPFFAIQVMKVMVDRLRKERKVRLDLEAGSSKDN